MELEPGLVLPEISFDLTSTLCQRIASVQGLRFNWGV